MVIKMLKVVLNKNEEKEKLEGFPWVFNNEIINFKGNIINGEVCEVVTSSGEFVAYGFLNTSSKIISGRDSAGLSSGWRACYE